MALIDKASLLMVPSTYEAGTLYNVLPSGNRAPDSTGENSGYDQTRADFTFDRGSNAAATRVNSEGLIEKYRENLLLYSEQFDTGWTLRRTTITPNATQNPNGQTTADAVFETIDNNYHDVDQGVSVSSGAVYTQSVYVKGGLGRDAFYIYNNDGTRLAKFNINTGEYIGSASNNAFDAYNSTDVGNGWFRYSVSVYGSAGGNARMNISPHNTLTNANDPYAGDTTKGIYLWGAQFELGLIATDYLDSGATTAKAGVLIDLPRINYDANGENGSLLLEPSRQQLITQSEYIGGSDWTFDSSSGINNATTSPDGLQNAALITGNGVDIDHTIYQLPVLSTGTYTLSAFVKKNTQRYVHLAFNQLNSSSLWSSSVFDLDTLIKADYSNGSGYNDGTSKIEDYGNDWYRISLTASIPNATTIIVFVGFAEDMSAPDTSRGRWSFATTNSFYAWGIQLEAGSYATSYIPNHGESGGVTRAADSCSVTGVSDVIGGTSGTIFFDVTMSESLTNSNYKQFFYYTDSGSNQTYMYVSNTNYIVGNPNLGNIISTTQLQAGERYKIAVTYATNSFKMYINGSEDATSSSGTPKDNENIISIGSYNGASEFNEFTFNQYAHFQEVLSDSELATLTTL